MNFVQQRQIPANVTPLLEEIEIIRPHVIIVHGRSIHEPLRRALAEKHSLEPIYQVELPEQERKRTLAKLYWNSAPNFTPLVAFFRHPSRGWLERDWQPIILPTIDRIQAELRRRSALLPESQDHLGHLA